MKVRLIALTGLLVAASFCACDNDDDSDTSYIVNGTDSAFVMQAGMGNTAEIRAAQLAKTKSTDSIILHYADMMIADHTTAQADLKTIAGRYGLTPPDSVDAAHLAKEALLATMTGRAFDSMYIHGQVADHTATIQLFQTETSSGNNVDLKSFATTTLPKLQMHLDSANSIAEGY